MADAGREEQFKKQITQSFRANRTNGVLYGRGTASRKEPREPIGGQDLRGAAFRTFENQEGNVYIFVCWNEHTMENWGSSQFQSMRKTTQIITNRRAAEEEAINNMRQANFLLQFTLNKHLTKAEANLAASSPELRKVALNYVFESTNYTSTKIKYIPSPTKFAENRKNAGRHIVRQIGIAHGDDLDDTTAALGAKVFLRKMNLQRLGMQGFDQALVRLIGQDRLHVLAERYLFEFQNAVLQKRNVAMKGTIVFPPSQPYIDIVDETSDGALYSVFENSAIEPAATITTMADLELLVSISPIAAAAMNANAYSKLSDDDFDDAMALLAPDDPKRSIVGGLEELVSPQYFDQWQAYICRPGQKCDYPTTGEWLGNLPYPKMDLTGGGQGTQKLVDWAVRVQQYAHFDLIAIGWQKYMVNAANSYRESTVDAEKDNLIRRIDRWGAKLEVMGRAMVARLSPQEALTELWFQAIPGGAPQQMA